MSLLQIAMAADIFMTNENSCGCNLQVLIEPYSN